MTYPLDTYYKPKGDNSTAHQITVSVVLSSASVSSDISRFDYANSRIKQQFNHQFSVRLYYSDAETLHAPSQNGRAHLPDCHITLFMSNFALSERSRMAQEKGSGWLLIATP